jgi:molecular chaperone DnaK
MVKTDKDHQAEDRKRRELIEARNVADNISYQTEKTLNDLGDKMPGDERQNIESKIKDLREAIKGEDTERIKHQTEELQNAFHALSQQLYAQEQPSTDSSNGNGRGPSGPEDEGEVVEGEFREA